MKTAKRVAPSFLHRLHALQAGLRAALRGLRAH